MSYLSDFEELNGGYVAFGGNPKGGKIYGKSVLQICDKENSIFFTDTECLVLSPDFKLPDESQVLLRVPRENNMYNVNLKHIFPSGDLTCLFAKAKIDESNHWHRRLGHINFKTMNPLVKGNLVRGLPIKVFENDNTCVACKKGKQHRASCRTKPVSSVDQPLYRLHMDLFGPTFVKSPNKKSYCLVVTDDYNRFTWVFFLDTKDESSPILKTFIIGLEKQLSLKAEAVNTAFYVHNRVLVIKPHNKTPYELLHGRTPSIGFMRPFGCPVTILNTLASLGKFDGKVDEGFLVGYSVSSKAFRVFNSRTRIVQETLHVNFLENKPNVAGSGPTWLFDIDTLIKTLNYKPVTAGNQSNPSAGVQEQFHAEKAGEEIEQQYVLFLVWSSGSTNPQNTNRDAAFDEKEPEFDEKKPESEVNVSLSSSAQSKKHDDKTEKRLKARVLINEVNAADTLVLTVGQISPNSTNTCSAASLSNAAASPTNGKSSFIDAYQLPDDPEMPELEDITYSDDEDDVGAEADFNNLETSITVSLIPTTRVHKDYPVIQIIGDLSSPTQTRSMTRVAKDQGGLSQINNEDFHTCMFASFLSQEEPKREEGIDYEEVFAPVARIEAIRLFLAYASFMGFMVYQMNVKSAFLYGTIEEEVYVCQPLGFEDPDHPDKVYKVVKALYGLRQAPRAWKFGLTDGKSASTPIDTEKPLLNDPDGEDVDVHTYRSIIGSLMYLTSSRPDIMFAVCACARFQVTPKASHQHVVKRIFRYLKGKPHLGLWYDSPFDLLAYSDSDYAGASLYRKSTTGGCQFIGCRLIFWQCKKQTVVATSSTKAEYVAAASCCVQVLWIQNQLLDYGSIKYALTVNLNIYVSCIKQFWTIVAVKNVNDVTRLQALVDKKKVIVTEATIRDALRLDDAEGVKRLPNEEIFAELARMGYEKPSTKLTFYKAFFSSQWKFLIHTILQCMSAKRTSSNEFSSSMASAAICLSPSRKFNFSKKQVGDLSTHTTKYTSPALTQKVFANMRWVGKGFFGVETPLFEGMLVAQEVGEGVADEVHDGVPAAGIVAEGDVSTASDEVPAADEELSIPSPTPPTPPPQPS
nr:uncharacterized mitochondrial protein AtMg00810-like [Tanacetum cinerariifolium]